MTRSGLLPAEALMRTSEADHADWNYRPLLGWVQRLRFAAVLSSLPASGIQRLLEVGYGSGVFMPVLKSKCEELYGIDTHEENGEVREVLSRYGVAAELVSGSVTEMPFDDEFFDCIVAVSCLEYVVEIERACMEMKRVLKSDGFVVIVTPGHAPILDWALKVLTGEDAQENYADRRRMLIPVLERNFAVEQRVGIPRWPRAPLRLYTMLRLTMDK